MEHDKKLAFLQNMTHMALTHAATAPNVPTPSGGMSHDKMLSFVSSIAQKGLQHFDAGGVTTAGGIGGAVGNVLGTNNGFQATAAPLTAGANAGQLATANNEAQSGLGAQSNITGILNNQLQQGVNSQGQLSNAYAAQAAGLGPNPAQAALNQATGQNIAQQAALAAGQRGAGANAGLIAAQNAQQGANTQQQAVGQAATQQAQQQLAAEQNLQNLSASQVAQGTGSTQALNSATQNEQNILQGANTSLNNANVAQQSNLNNVNSGVSIANQNSAGNAISGIGGLASSIPLIGSLFAKGGMVKAPQKMAAGGITGEATSGPQSYVGQWLNSNVDTQGPGQMASANLDTSADNNLAQGLGQIGSSVGNQVGSLGPQNKLKGFDANQALAASPATGASDLAGAADLAFASRGGLMQKGGKVAAKDSSQKAVTKGDSLSNDKVPAMLSQGELVIDRDTMQDPGPMGQMARALAQHISKRNKK